MTRPTHTELNIAITIGVVASAVVAYVGHETIALLIALPANVVWVWEGKIERQGEQQ